MMERSARVEPDRALIARLSAQIDEVQRRSHRIDDARWVEPGADDARWVEPGEAVEIQGATVPGGAFYLGTALTSPLLHGDDPALVNPELKVDLGNPDATGADMQYWPAYGSITPAQRAVYIRWLASDRNAVQMPIGFVFMYFYGFERRVFVDLLGTPRLQRDLPWIRSEVQRLRRVYGSNPSLDGYTERFLWAIDCLGESPAPGEPPAIHPQAWQIPASLKLGLGRLAVAGRPIPVQWALAWLKADPEGFLRTPAERCPAEFSALFVHRYQQRYGDGLLIKPNRKKLALSYHPASRSFGNVALPIGSIPDVTALKGPTMALRQLAQECTDALAAYSRWLGRHPHDRGSLAAIALLPAELVHATPNDALGRLERWMASELAGRDEVAVDGAALLAFWPKTSSGKLPTRESALLCELLAKDGYGIEPDVRFGGPAIGRSRAVIFHDAGAGAGPPPRWEQVVATLDLALAVAALEPEDDGRRSALAHQLGQALELPEPVRPRVRAHLHWAALAAPSLNQAKRALSGDTQATREGLGQFLVELATQRGVVGPAQVAGLTRAYAALGLEPASMFSLIHQRSVAPSREPVEVRPPGHSVTGEKIPAPPAAGPDGTISLDPAVVAATLAASAASTALLGKIFVDDDVAPAPVQPAPSPDILGTGYATLLERLATHATLTHAAFVSLATELGLLPNRAIEVLNEAALDRWGDPVLEGDEVLEVNHDALKELLG